MLDFLLSYTVQRIVQGGMKCDQYKASSNILSECASKSRQKWEGAIRYVTKASWICRRTSLSGICLGKIFNLALHEKQSKEIFGPRSRQKMSLRLMVIQDMEEAKRLHIQN